MLTTYAIDLKPGDTFTNDDGQAWHEVLVRMTVPTNSGKEAILIVTAASVQMWLWADESVTVQI